MKTTGEQAAKWTLLRVFVHTGIVAAIKVRTLTPVWWPYLMVEWNRECLFALVLRQEIALVYAGMLRLPIVPVWEDARLIFSVSVFRVCRCFVRGYSACRSSLCRMM